MTFNIKAVFSKAPETWISPAGKSVEKCLFGHQFRKTPMRVTPYHWPDLDGIACAFTIQELLKSKGYLNSSGMIAQTPQKEAAWVMEKLHISFPKVEDWMSSKKNTDQVILVDVSDHKDLPPHFPTEKIKAVIDHRSYSDLSRMKNAAHWIELVGSAATLVGELCLSQGVKPDLRSAQLLHAAIMSNTIGLSTRNTTDRDRRMVQYLNSFTQINTNLVRDMFLEKSRIESDSLFSRIDEDLSSKTYKLGDFSTAVAQLEIMEVEQLFLTRKTELKGALSQLKKDRNADQIFLIAVDISIKKTFFYFESTEMYNLVSSKFALRDKNFYSFVDEVVTRKDVISSFIVS